jgi:hypothetical protein
MDQYLCYWGGLFYCTFNFCPGRFLHGSGSLQQEAGEANSIKKNKNLKEKGVRKEIC